MNNASGNSIPCPAAAGSPLLLEACRWRWAWRLCVPSSPAFTSFPTTTATDRSILRPPGCSSSHGRQLSHEASPGALNRHWLAPSCSMLSMAAYLPSCLDLLCLGIALAARTLLSLPTFPCFTYMTDKTNSNTSKLAPYLVAKFKIPKKNSGTYMET